MGDAIGLVDLKSPAPQGILRLDQQQTPGIASPWYPEKSENGKVIGNQNIQLFFWLPKQVNFAG